ncbi:MAG: ATP-binding protein [Phycisphaerae bacterium]|nr:ATP-binding protein [Phycisphaerae bacterium]
MREVTTYERLERHIDSWVTGEIPFLGIVGPPGTGKTHAYESLDGPRHVFRGRTSAITMFESISERPDDPIILDDIRKLLRDADCLDLLKQLCDTRRIRTVRWHTRALAEEDRQFVCSSKVLVVLNWVPKSDSDVEAILDRFDVIRFEPTKSEIIARMRLFAEDQRDVDIIANAPIMPSLRTLVHFQQWKAAPRLNEIEELYSECGMPENIRQMVEVLETTPKGQWIKAYQRLSGKKYEAAKRDWSRHYPVAQQLMDARVPEPSGDDTDDEDDEGDDDDTWEVPEVVIVAEDNGG